MKATEGLVGFVGVGAEVLRRFGAENRRRLFNPLKPLRRGYVGVKEIKKSPRS